MESLKNKISGYKARRCPFKDKTPLLYITLLYLFLIGIFLTFINLLFVQAWLGVTGLLSTTPRWRNPAISAFPNGTTSKLVIHTVPLMLNVKQRSCEYQFYSHWFDPTRNQTRVYNCRGGLSCQTKALTGLGTNPSDTIEKFVPTLYWCWQFQGTASNNIFA